MADVVYGQHAPTYGRAEETHPETTFLGSVLKRTSWGAVLAGAVTAITVQMLLTVLGVAVGITAIELSAEPDVYVRDGIKTGAGVWWFITGTVSLLVGGCVVGRFAGMTRSPDVLLHAFTMWGITALFGFFAVTAGAGAIYGTAMNASYAGAQAYYNPSSQQAAAGNTIQRNDTTADSVTPVDRIDQEEAKRFVRTAAWWTFAGLLAGIGASLAGCWLTTPERIALTSPVHGAPNRPVTGTSVPRAPSI